MISLWTRFLGNVDSLHETYVNRKKDNDSNTVSIEETTYKRNTI